MWKNKHGIVTQNVLAACNFDMRFTYVLPGWEGSAPDARVLGDAASNQGLAVPSQSYYLADAAYHNTDWLLTPYRGVRSRFSESEAENAAPENAKELFNLRHAALRQVVDRSIGALRKRFRCIRSMPNFSIRHQIRLVFAITAIHNFVRAHRHAAEEDDVWEELEETDDEEADPTEDLPEWDQTFYTTSEAMNAKRDQMAEDMWSRYQQQRSPVP